MSHAPCVNVSHAHPRTLLSAPHLLRLMAYITQEYAVAHCNTFSALQHTATHRNSLQRTALYIPHKHTHTHTHTPSGIRRTHTHTHTSTPTHPLTRPHIHTSSLSRARRTHLHIRHFISSSRPPQQKKKKFSLIHSVARTGDSCIFCMPYICECVTRTPTNCVAAGAKFKSKT